MSFWKKVSSKKKLLFIGLIIICLFFIYQSDNTQQKNYATVKDAYKQMQEGNYETAAEEFQQYLDSHSTKIYWRIQKIVNKNDESSYEEVEIALKECQKNLNNNK